jgi:2-phosphosulfolactate phosphatase
MLIETILTPALFHLHSKDIENKQVVVIDILRATTTMVVAYENGANNVVPVEHLEDALSYREQGYLIAGERNGVKVDGFDMGNSPQEFTKDIVEGQNIVLSTTNGTKAINACSAAKFRYVSSFRNIDAMAKTIIDNNLDVLLFCAGWKDKFNLEDTVFAGALAQQLIDNGFTTNDDATRMACSLWNLAKPNLADFLADASHVQRFKSLHIESDLEVCLRFNTYSDVVRV